MTRHVSVETAYNLRDAGLLPAAIELNQYWYDEQTGRIRIVGEIIGPRIRMKKLKDPHSVGNVFFPATATGLLYVPCALEIISLFPEPYLVTLRLLHQWKATLTVVQNDIQVETEYLHLCPHEAVAQLYIAEKPNFPLSLRQIKPFIKNKRKK